MKKLKETNAGTYRGLELQGVDEALEQRPAREAGALRSDADLEQKTEEVQYA